MIVGHIHESGWRPPTWVESIAVPFLEKGGGPVVATAGDP